MKQILLIVVALVVIGGGFYLYAQRAATPEATPDIADVNDDADAMEDMDHEAMEEDTTTVGSDAGMEFPTVDDTEAKVFNITGQNFAFSMHEIRVQEGDRVVINFESTGGFHDWTVDEFNAQTDRVNTGGRTSVTFIADRKGTFEYYCSVGNHRAQGMVGMLIVE